MSNLEIFKKSVLENIKNFENNDLINKIKTKDFSMTLYHNILLTIFHQTFEGPSTFALAAAHTDPLKFELKSYFMHHAEEEKDHWKWVIDDLKNTGYTGPDPRTVNPSAPTHAYVAYNFFTAMRHPLSRLAIAVVLESIGASCGKKYATMLCQTLNLKPNQAVFFFGHGDTDMGHTKDLYDLIKSLHLGEDDFNKMIHAGRVGGELYRNLYNFAAR